MKKREKLNFKKIYISLCFSILLISCEKIFDSNDFRDDFTGTYSCKNLTLYWNIGIQGVDTLENFMDTVEVSKNKVLPNQLKINNKSYKISEDGYFYQSDSDYSTYQYYTEEITFRNDSIFMIFYDGEKNSGTTYYKWGKKN